MSRNHISSDSDPLKKKNCHPGTQGGLSDRHLHVVHSLVDDMHQFSGHLFPTLQMWWDATRQQFVVQHQQGPGCGDLRSKEEQRGWMKNPKSMMEWEAESVKHIQKKWKQWYFLAFEINKPWRQYVKTSQVTHWFCTKWPHHYHVILVRESWQRSLPFPSSHSLAPNSTSARQWHRRAQWETGTFAPLPACSSSSDSTHKCQFPSQSWKRKVERSSKQWRAECIADAPSRNWYCNNL